MSNRIKIAQLTHGFVVVDLDESNFLAGLTTPNDLAKWIADHFGATNVGAPENSEVVQSFDALIGEARGAVEDAKDTFKKFDDYVVDFQTKLKSDAARFAEVAVNNSKPVLQPDAPTTMKDVVDRNRPGPKIEEISAGKQSSERSKVIEQSNEKQSPESLSSDSYVSNRNLDDDARKLIYYLNDNGAKKDWIKASYADIGNHLNLGAVHVQTLLEYVKNTVPNLRVFRSMSGENKGNNFTFNPDIEEPGAPFKNIEWNDTRVKKAANLWADGATMEEIGIVFKTTRHSVAGMINRNRSKFPERAEAKPKKIAKPKSNDGLPKSTRVGFHFDDLTSSQQKVLERIYKTSQSVGAKFNINANTLCSKAGVNPQSAGHYLSELNRKGFIDLTMTGGNALISIEAAVAK